MNDAQVEEIQTDEWPIPDLGPAQIDAVLAFLPDFERPGWTPGQWESRPGVFPFYSLRDDVIQFLDTLYESGFAYTFNAVEWEPQARRFMADRSLIAAADLQTLRRLMIYHVRCDRFSEGHLGAMLEEGHITTILQRVRQIREVLWPKGPEAHWPKGRA